LKKSARARARDLTAYFLFSFPGGVPIWTPSFAFLIFTVGTWKLPAGAAVRFGFACRIFLSCTRKTGVLLEFRAGFVQWRKKI